ncbi:MAG: hypothetical protein GF381_03100 [Candidatus Pacebacteria bacterium]|nr:hypothetical protein [Candidatus Paceibacterota bacterium]
MIDYSSLIQQLLGLELEKPEEQMYFLSIYQPNTGLSKDQIKLRLKSQLLAAFHGQDNLAHDDRLEQELLEQISQEVDQLDGLKKGLAVFVKLDVKSGKKIKLQSPVFVVPLERTPKKEAQLSQSFDLDQLLLAAYSQLDALIINLHRKTFRIYHLLDSDLKLIKEQENEFIGEMPNEGLETHAPLDQQSGIYHGTGTNTHQRRLLKQNQLFMNQLEQYLVNQLGQELKTKFKYVLIFYSDYFQEVISGLGEAIRDRIGSQKLELIHKTLYNDQQVQEQAKKKFRQLQNARRQSLAADLKEKFYQVKKGWTNVTRAARNGQIRRLFIKPDTNKTGYIGPEQLIYTYPEKDTKQVKNLAAWLVSAVENQSGQVVVMKGQEYQDCPAVMAELRYQLDQ